MSKEKRRKEEIKLRIKEIVKKRESLNAEKHVLIEELDYMNGHYDKTWEERFAREVEDEGK